MTIRHQIRLGWGLVGLVLGASVTLALTTMNSTGSHNHMAAKKLMEGSSVPAPVRAFLQRACQDCHSENTAWPWYAHIPPVSWQIQSDVAKGRAFMDLSRWNDYTEAERQAFMMTIEAAIQNHLMPPPKYVWMHPEARVSADELELLRVWVSAKSKTGSQNDRGRLALKAPARAESRIAPSSFGSEQGPVKPSRESGDRERQTRPDEIVNRPEKVQ